MEETNELIDEIEYRQGEVIKLLEKATIKAKEDERNRILDLINDRILKLKTIFIDDDFDSEIDELEQIKQKIGEMK